MGKPVYAGTVGQRVYQNFKPLKAGIIVADLGPEQIKRPDNSVYISSFHTVTVKWVDNTVSDCSTSGLADFDTLIEDHQRKLKTHLATLEKLNKL